MLDMDNDDLLGDSPDLDAEKIEAIPSYLQQMLSAQLRSLLPIATPPLRLLQLLKGQNRNPSQACTYPKDCSRRKLHDLLT
ncbi:hypothetical protein Bca101_059032 [Brassica carinata]